MPALPPGRWTARRLACTIFVVALAIRVVYLFDIRDNPFFHAPVIDAEFYRDLGLALARGEGTGRAPFMMPPGYPLLLSLLFRIAGTGLFVPHLVQIVLGAGAAALTSVVGWRVGGLWVGALAGGLVATSRALLFVEGDLLATPLVVLLDLAFLLFLARFVEDGERRRDLVGAGVCVGLAALARPTVLASFAVLLAWMAFVRRRGAAAVGLLAVAWLVILPVTWHNMRASGRLVWISANGGINFFIGNNPDMRRTVALRPGPEWRRMNDLPLREAGLVHPVDRDRWFYSEGLRFWRDSPAMALTHTFEKAVRLLHNHESMRDFDFYYFARHYSRVLRVPGCSFALLLGFALVGLTRAGSTSPTRRILVLFLLSYAAGIVLFFVSARYRAPLLPVLSVFAAGGAVWLWGAARRRAWRDLSLAAAVFGLTVAVSSIDWYGAGRVDEVQALYRVGTAYQNRGDCTAALRTFEQVLRRDPHHALAAARAALCEQQLGRLQAAVSRYEALLDTHPDYVEPMVNLANLAWQHGDVAMAANYFELAIRTDPWFAPAYGHYGRFVLARGEPARAVALFSRALDNDPAWEALRLDLARALVAADRPSDALDELHRAREVMPASDVSELVRGDALRSLGREAEARAAWEAGLRLNPSNPQLRRRLGRGAGPGRR